MIAQIYAVCIIIFEKKIDLNYTCMHRPEKQTSSSNPNFSGKKWLYA
jgi:hypothetical protein